MKATDTLRRMKVENVGGGKCRYTCQTCGHSSTKTVGGADKMAKKMGRTVSLAALEQLAKYQAATGYVTGHCKHCAKGAKQ